MKRQGYRPDVRAGVAWLRSVLHRTPEHTGWVGRRGILLRAVPITSALAQELDRLWFGKREASSPSSNWLWAQILVSCSVRGTGPPPLHPGFVCITDDDRHIAAWATSSQVQVRARAPHIGPVYDLSFFEVSPFHVRRGHGKTVFLEQICPHARSLGASHIFVESFPESVAFYERIGMTRASRADGARVHRENTPLKWRL